MGSVVFRNIYQTSDDVVTTLSLARIHNTRHKSTTENAAKTAHTRHQVPLKCNLVSTYPDH